MKITCPRCQRPIPLDDINVAKDLALCRECQATFSFAELNAEQPTSAAVDLSRPPNGAWFRTTPRGFVVGATTRSSGAFFLVPFTLFWSGLSMGGIYGSQIWKGNFNLGASLFGLPFLAGTCFLVPTSLMMVLGRQEVRMEGGEAVVFTGVGPIGWRRRVAWKDVTGVRTTVASWRRNNRQVPQITLQGDKPLNFGSGFTDARREYVLGVLRRLVGKAG